jgi:hypothetical protein
LRNEHGVFKAAKKPAQSLAVLHAFARGDRLEKQVRYTTALHAVLALLSQGDGPGYASGLPSVTSPSIADDTWRWQTPYLTAHRQETYDQPPVAKRAG